MKRFIAILLLFALGVGFSKEVGFIQEDRERLIRLEATVKVFMEQADKRFRELREDMNKRFEQVDKRFEQIDKRFEQVNNELDRLVGLVGAVIAFVWWDRRTIIREAKRQTIEELERETKPGKLRRLLNALREKAKTGAELRDSQEGGFVMSLLTSFQKHTCIRYTCSSPCSWVPILCCVICCAL